MSFRKRLGKLLLFGVMVWIAASTAIWIWFLSPAGQSTVHTLVAEAANATLPAGEAQVDRVSLSLTGVELGGVRWIDGQGTEALRVDTLSVSVAWFPLLRGEVQLTNVAGEGIRIVVADEDGKTNWHALTSSDQARSSERWPVWVSAQHISLSDVDFSWQDASGTDTVAFGVTDISGSFSGDGQSMAIGISALEATVEAPIRAPVNAAAELQYASETGWHIDVLEGDVGSLDVSLAGSTKDWRATVHTDGFALEDWGVETTSNVWLAGGLAVVGQGVVWPQDVVARATLTEGQLRVDDMELQEGVAKLELRGGDLSFAELSFDSPLGVLVAAGTLDIPNETVVATLEGRLNELLKTDDVSVDGMYSTQVVASLNGEQIHAMGTADLASLRAPAVDGWVAGGQASWEVIVDDRVPSGTVEWTMGPLQVLGLHATSGRGSVALRGDAADWEFQLEDGGRTLLGAAGSYAFDDRRVVIGGIPFSPTPRVQWNSPFPLSFRLAEDGISDALLALESSVGALQFEGDVRQDALQGQLEIDSLHLGHLSDWGIASLADVSGRLGASVALNGRVDAPRARGAFNAHDLSFQERIRHASVNGTFELADDVLHLDATVGNSDTDFGTVEGSVSTSKRSFGTWSVTLAEGPIARLARLSGDLEALGLPKGRIGGTLIVDGPPHDPNLTLELASRVHLPSWPGPMDLEIVARRQGSEVTVDAAMADGQGAALSFRGTGRTPMQALMNDVLRGETIARPEDWRTWLSGVDGSLSVRDLPIASVVGDAMRPVELGGTVSGDVDVRGEGNAIVLDGSLVWNDARVGDHLLASVVFSFEQGTKERTRFSIVSHFEEEGAFEADGSINLSDIWHDAFNVVFQGDRIPLALLNAWWPGRVYASGVSSVRGSVRGTLASPDPSLVLSVDGGEISLPEIGIVARNFDVQAAADANRIEVATFRAYPSPVRRLKRKQDDASARIEGSVAAEFVDGTLGAIDGRVAFVGSPSVVAIDDLGMWVDGHVDVTGMWPAPHVAGAIEIDRGRVVIDAASAVGVAPLQPDPRLTIVRSRADGRGSAVREPFRSLLHDMTLDVDVSLRNAVDLSMALPFVDQLGALAASVTTADVDTRLLGGFRVVHDQGVWQTIGEVELQDGHVRLLRSRFDLNDGRIVLPGGDVLEESQVNLQAAWTIPQASVSLEVSGPPAAPDIDLRSDEYPDRADQVSLLLTGGPPEDIQPQEGLGLLFNSLLSSGQQLVSLTIEPDGSVRVGVPIGPRLYTATRIGLPTKLADTADQKQTPFELEVEWSPVRGIGVDASVSEASGTAEVFFERRF